MKISVIMPVYNAEKHLRFSVGSVLGQTHEDWELVCVDDGSTDSSGKTLDEFAAKDARIRVIHKTNGGEGSARNAGLDVATGELIAFLDADDAFHPEGLALFDAVAQMTSADVIRYGWRAVAAHAQASGPLPGPSCASVVDLPSRTESTVRFCALGCVTVISRRACGDVRFCALSQGADMVFVLDCLLKAQKTVFIDAPILNYLSHADSISRRVSTGLIIGTCGYIPELVDRCARLGESPAAAADTRCYMAEFIFRRLPGSWNLFKRPEDRTEVRLVFWGMLKKLVDRPDYFGAFERRLIGIACRFESRILLALFATFPYRLRRRLCR